MAQTGIKLNFPGQTDCDSDMEESQAGKKAKEGVRKYLWNQLDASREALTKAKLELDRQNDQVNDVLSQLKGECQPTASSSLNINKRILQKRQERKNAEKSKIRVEQVEKYPPCSTSNHVYVAWIIENGSSMDMEDLRVSPRACDGEVPTVHILRGFEGDGLNSGNTAWVLVEIRKDKLVFQAAQSQKISIEVFLSCKLNGQRVVVQGENVELSLIRLVEQPEQSWSAISSLLFCHESIAVQVTSGGFDMLRENHLLDPVKSYFDIFDVYAPGQGDFPFLNNLVVQVIERSGDELLDVQIYGPKFQILALLRFIKNLIGNKLLFRGKNETKYTYSELKASLLEELDLILEGTDGATRVSDVCPAISDESTSMQELFKVKKTVLAADKKSAIKVPSVKYFDPEGPWQRARQAEFRTDKIMYSLSKK